MLEMDKLGAEYAFDVMTVEMRRKELAALEKRLEAAEDARNAVEQKIEDAVLAAVYKGGHQVSGAQLRPLEDGKYILSFFDGIRGPEYYMMYRVRDNRFEVARLKDVKDGHFERKHMHGIDIVEEWIQPESEADIAAACRVMPKMKTAHSWVEIVYGHSRDDSPALFFLPTELSKGEVAIAARRLEGASVVIEDLGLPSFGKGPWQGIMSASFYNELYEWVDETDFTFEDFYAAYVHFDEDAKWNVYRPEDGYSGPGLPVFKDDEKEDLLRRGLSEDAQAQRM